MKKVTELAQRLLKLFLSLSRREQLMVGAGALFVLVMGLQALYAPIVDAFAEQSNRLAKAQTQAKATGAVIDRYVRFKQRREILEKQFKEVEFSEGVLSHLENLIRTKGQISSGFDIKDGTPKAFGKLYQQVPYTIRFQSTNLGALVELLNEFVHGARPLILSRLDLQKPRRGDRLEVEIEVSTLRRVTATNSTAPSTKSTT